MAIVTDRPNSTDSAGVGFTIAGAGSMHSAVSDDSDGSYIRCPASFSGTPEGEQPRLGFPNTALPGGSEIQRVRLRLRVTDESTPLQETYISLVLVLAGVYDSTHANSSSAWAGFGAPLNFTGPWRTLTPAGDPWDQAALDAVEVRVRTFSNTTASLPARLYEVWRDIEYVEGVAPPTLTVVASVDPDDLRPDFEWDFSDPDTRPQEVWRARVFSSDQYTAGGFDPDVDTPVWDSGDIASVTDRDSTVGTDLVDGTSYRVYVRVALTDTPSDEIVGWEPSNEVTISITPDPPPPPPPPDPGGIDTYSDAYSDLYGAGLDLSDVWPALVFEIGFDASPLDALSTVVWTDISFHVRGWTCEWGKQHELNQFEPGRLSVEIGDQNREFDSANTASTYAGKITPLRRIRVKATWAGVTYDIFYGYVLVWPRTWEYQSYGYVHLEAVDALGVLNLWPLFGSPWEQIQRNAPGNAWLRLGESDTDHASAASDSTGNGFEGQYQNGIVAGPKLVAGDDTTSVFFEHTADQRVAIGRNDLLTGYPFSVEFWFRTEQDRSKFKVAFAGEGDGLIEIGVRSTSAGADAGKMSGILQAGGGLTIWNSSSTVDDGLTHHCVVEFDSATTGRIYIDGTVGATSIATAVGFPQIMTGWAIGNSPAAGASDFGFDGYLQDVVVHQGVTLSAGQVLERYLAGVIGGGGDDTGSRTAAVLDGIGWPNADSEIDSGKSTLDAGWRGGGTLSYLQDVAQSEQGAFLADHRNQGKLTFRHRHRRYTEAAYTTSQFTFSDSDSASEVHYESPAAWGVDHADIRNIAVVTREGGAQQTARDTASVTAYGERRLPMTVLHDSDAQAKDLATWLVGRHSSPITRVRQVVCLPQFNPGHDWPLILGAEMGQRVTFTASPPGGSTFEQEAHVEHIRHEMIPSTRWQVTFDLSAAEVEQPWILGTSALGTGTRLGL